MYRFLAPLFEGPIDVIGDVHGERAALEHLLTVLGYTPDGRHAHGRRLVFVGDLTDRGPDSVGVALLVAGMVREGRAQCVAGNHELSLLRRLAKEGNGWFYERNHDHERGKFASSRSAQEHHRGPIEEFFRSLPLALERPDLRIVHACWHAPAIDALRRCTEPGLLEAFTHFSHAIDRQLEDEGWNARRRASLDRLGERLYDRAAQPAWDEALAHVEEVRQDQHPVRAATSGLERRTPEPFYAGGKWRMVERVRWWNEYQDPVPVVFGHYWRRPVHEPAPPRERASAPDVFEGSHFTEWLGPARSAFCVDFSVGRRYVEVERGLPHGSASRLGALRWPERELVFENGERFPTR